MTTAIRDAAGKGRSWIIRDADTHVSITGSTSDGTIDRASLVDRADFLRAVATELDVIVIPRSDLPTPVPHPTNPDLAYVRTLTASRGRTAQSPDVLMDRALDYIAAAEWAAAEPPVDEAQVGALADLIIEADGTESVTQKLAIRRVARELVKAGVRAPEAGGDQ